MRTLPLVAILIPSVLFSAEKPSCETILKLVEDARGKSLAPLEAELASLEKLREDIRRGRGKLPGKDGMKSKREQFRIAADKIEAVEKKIAVVKKSTPLPQLKFGSMKPGDFGEFGVGEVDFLVHEIIDETTFTARIQYVVMVRNPGGIVAYRPLTKATSSLFLVKGIPTKGKVDGKPANWDGFIFCSGTKTLSLNTGNETVFVLEPMDISDCFKPPKP